MSNHDDNPVGLERLLKDLGSVQADVRNQAVSEARRLPAEQLLALANAEAKQHRREKRAQWGNGIALLLSIILLAALFLSEPQEALLFFLMWCAFFSWTMTQVALHFTHLFYLRRSMVALIEARQDTSFVGHALLMLRDADKNLRLNLVGVLIRLLPQLRAEDVRVWSKEQKAALLNLLDDWKDISIFLHIPISIRTRSTKVADSMMRRGVLNIPISTTSAWGPALTGYKAELMICVLKALEQVGDETALGPVRRLAALSPARIEENIRCYRQADVSSLRGSAFWEDVKRVRQAAVECLEALEVRLESREQAQTLLRASDSTHVDPSGTLLRPAVGGNETASEELLRPLERQGG
jgi:hypothetical protein